MPIYNLVQDPSGVVISQFFAGSQQEADDAAAAWGHAVFFSDPALTVTPPADVIPPRLVVIPPQPVVMVNPNSGGGDALEPPRGATDLIFNLRDFNGNIISQFDAPSQQEADTIAARWGTAELYSYVPQTAIPPGESGDHLSTADNNNWMWIAAGVGLLFLIKRR